MSLERKKKGAIQGLLAVRWRNVIVRANEQGIVLNLGFKRKRGGYSSPCSCFSWQTRQ